MFLEIRNNNTCQYFGVQLLDVLHLHLNIIDYI